MENQNQNPPKMDHAGQVSTASYGYSLLERELVTSAGRVNLVAGGLVASFLEIYSIHWLCEKAHTFGQDQIGSPTKCSVCQSPMFRSVIEKRETK